MRITPIEIRQHTFDKSFRGYDTESVEAFLLSLSQEWERVGEEVRQSKQKIETAEREIAKMKEVETGLFKTIKVAEEAKEQMNSKAFIEAENIKTKAREEAEEILNEARKKANMMVSDAENKAKFLIEEANNELKNYERDFKSMERYKEFLVVELKRFANETLEKVSKFEERVGNKSYETASEVAESKPKKEIADFVEAVSLPKAPVEIVPKAIVPPIPEKQSSITVSFFEQEESSDVEIDFEPANDYDDENAELPQVHKILAQQAPEVPKNIKAEELVKEMKAVKPKPRKTPKDDGLPTVSSVMEDFGKDYTGGSFFDSF
jgi:cell division initiation protein